MESEFLPPVPDAAVKAKDLFERTKEHAEQEIARVKYQFESGCGDALWLIDEVEEQTRIAEEMLSFSPMQLKTPDTLYHTGSDKVIRRGGQNILAEFPKLVAVPIYSEKWLYNMHAGFSIRLSAQVQKNNEATPRIYTIDTPAPRPRACALAEQVHNFKTPGLPAHMWLVFQATCKDEPQSMLGVKHAAIVIVGQFVNQEETVFLKVDKWEYEYDENGNYNKQICLCYSKRSKPSGES